MAPEKVKHIVLASVVLHNIMRTRYPGLQNAVLDREGNHHRLIPGLWKNGGVMQELDEVRAPTGDTQCGKRQRTLFKNYVNSPQEAVPWQREMI